MIEALRRYSRWLHTQWPAGRVEPLPGVRPDGSTAVPGLWIAGDLAGVPLLKFAIDSGARVARRIAGTGGREAPGSALADLVVVGAGPAGMAAALEARRLGLRCIVLEAEEPFATVADYPERKPIFPFPAAMTPAGELQVAATVKEALLEELRAQAAAAGIEWRRARSTHVARAREGLAVHLEQGAPVPARNVLVAIGRSGDRRRLDVPGEAPPRVFHRLHDAHDFVWRDVLVTGGGDSAAEAVIALAAAGARVTFAHRSGSLVRPNPRNLAGVRALERSGRITVLAGTRVREVRERDVVMDDGRTIPNDVVFALLGREAPLGFLRRSGVSVPGGMTPRRWLALAGFVAFMAWFDDWKAGGFFSALWQRHGWFPFGLVRRCEALGGAFAAAVHDPRTLAGTIAVSASEPAFWGTLLYTIVVIVFGFARIRRRRTPYVTAQTWTLGLVQVLPLFLLPEIVLPWLGHNGWLPKAVADALFPVVSYGHGREYWRAYGFVFAFPLDVYNVFTDRPLSWWLAITAVQTLVLIPAAVWLWGKGAYCGWFCSCGALAETLGDTHRHKMPHGPGWNRLNMAGQALLAVSVVLLLVRIAGWLLPGGNWIQRNYMMTFLFGWKWIVDIVIGSVVGVGFYFWYSGRVWCRFFCPLAAWMHVLARFSRFAILAEKPRCISCNQCTAQCHMGIDVMSFAQRGEPVRDPECVRCSACVGACPTGVLQFGSVSSDGTLVSVDALPASPVRGREAAPGR